MSTLLADTIRKTGGSLGVDIRVKNTSVYESEGGTSVTQSITQGLVKCWCNFDGTASGAASRDSFNVSGMTDNSTGNYTVTVSNNMGSANTSATQSIGDFDGTSETAAFNYPFNNATTGCSFLSMAYNDGNNSDRSGQNIMICGDLA